jgi:hypothetical protein
MWNRHSLDFYIPGGGPPGYLHPQVVVPTDRPKSFVCPENHVEQARTFIQNCQHFLLIGFGGRDEDVVDLFREMPSHSRLAIVSKGDARKIHTRMSSGVVNLKSKKLTVSFHDMGFSEFVGHKAFDKFLQV